MTQANKIQSTYCYATTTTTTTTTTIRASNEHAATGRKGRVEFEDVKHTVSFLFSFPHPISLGTSQHLFLLI
jgi:hypothetical protein